MLRSSHNPQRGTWAPEPLLSNSKRSTGSYFRDRFSLLGKRAEIRLAPAKVGVAWPRLERSLLRQDVVRRTLTLYVTGKSCLMVSGFVSASSKYTCHVKLIDFLVSNKQERYIGSRLQCSIVLQRVWTKLTSEGSYSCNVTSGKSTRKIKILNKATQFGKKSTHFCPVCATRKLRIRRQWNKWCPALWFFLLDRQNNASRLVVNVLKPEQLPR